MPSCLATASAVRLLSPLMSTTLRCSACRINQIARRASRFGASSTDTIATGTNVCPSLVVCTCLGLVGLVGISGGAISGDFWFVGPFAPLMLPAISAVWLDGGVWRATAHNTEVRARSSSARIESSISGEMVTPCFCNQERLPMEITIQIFQIHGDMRPSTFITPHPRSFGLQTPPAKPRMKMEKRRGTTKENNFYQKFEKFPNF